MNQKEVTFTKKEFMGMFMSELNRCYKNCIEKSCKGPIHDNIKIYTPIDNIELEREYGLEKLKLPESALLTIEQAVERIHRDDGWYRIWINISPLAVTANELIIEILYSDKWTNKIIVESYAPVEPFQLRGPALPPNWRIGDSVPRVKLPILEIKQMPNYLQKISIKFHANLAKHYVSL